MTIARSMTILAAVTLPVLLASADDLSVNNDNPYTSIVTRNVFGLLPIPVKDPNADPQPAVQPPKITPNGIITIFGEKEALYKVAGTPKPGQPAQDQSYELGEGESQDDIEVVKIDVPAQTITFNNHGTVQQLPLAAAPNLNTPPPAAAAPGVPVPVGRPFPRPGGFGGSGGLTPRQVRNQNTQNAANPNNPNLNTGTGGGSSPDLPISAADTEGLSPEAQVILMEAQRAKWQNEPDTSPNPNIIPTTPLTDQNKPDNGGPPGP